MWGRVAYLIPIAFACGIVAASLLGSKFRGRVPAPPYSQADVVFYAGITLTVASGLCLLASRPRWWHALLWPAMIFWMWSIAPIFAW
jgi:hypothetical protein